MICWIAGVGELTACLLGAHLFAWLYFVLNGRVYVWHLAVAGGIVVTLFWMWKLFFTWMFWCWNHHGDLRPMTAELIAETIDWRRALRWSAPALIVSGLGGLLECLVGDLLAGVMALFYVLLAAFAVGAYGSLGGDLLLRTLGGTTDLPAPPTPAEQEAPALIPVQLEVRARVRHRS